MWITAIRQTAYRINWNRVMMWYKPYNTSLISGSIHASGQQHAIPVQKGAYLQKRLTNSMRLFFTFFTHPETSMCFISCPQSVAYLSQLQTPLYVDRHLCCSVENCPFLDTIFPPLSNPEVNTGNSFASRHVIYSSPAVI